MSNFYLSGELKNVVDFYTIQPNETEYFCYIYISSIQQAWTCVAYFCIAIYLLLKSIKQYKVTKITDRLNFYVKYTYFSIFASLAFYISKILFSQIIFWIQWGTINNHTPEVYRSYSIASKFVAFIDMSEVFSIMTAVIFVPANWVNNVIQLSKRQTIIQRESRSNVKFLQKSTAFQKKCKKILQIYLIIRCVFTYVPFIPFFILDNQDILQGITLYMLIFVQIQFLILFLVLLAGVISIKNNDLIKDLLVQKDIKLMQKHYFILILCTILRLLTDMIFTLFATGQITHQPQCFIRQNSTLQLYSNIIVILMEALFTQFFSVYSILKIYHVSQAEILKYESTFTTSTKDKLIQN